MLGLNLGGMNRLFWVWDVCTGLGPHTHIYIMLGLRPNYQKTQVYLIISRGTSESHRLCRFGNCMENLFCNDILRFRALSRVIQIPMLGLSYGLGLSQAAQP